MASRAHPGTPLRTETDRPLRSDADTSPEARQARAWPWIQGDTRTLLLAAVAGLTFGFLLQKGGVAKFDILLGVLLLENFIVVKIILSAITVGMVGFHLLARRGAVEPKIQEAAYGSNVAGGLLFGAGFAMLAYCPGTNIAAVGQGNLDALVGAAGLVLGSYLFALVSQRGEPSKLGKRGKLTIHELLRMPRGAVVIMAVPLFVGVLWLLQVYAP